VLQPHESSSETKKDGDDLLVYGELQPHESSSETVVSAARPAVLCCFNLTRVRLKPQLAHDIVEGVRVLQPHESSSETI